MPAALTICVLILHKVDGDPLTGICSVGNFNSFAMRNFVLIPLAICLGIYVHKRATETCKHFLGVGVFFLLCGFIAMLRIRSHMKDAQPHKEAADLGKLEKLMLRISAFSVMYIVPAVMTVACSVYQYTMMPQWLHSWYNVRCNQVRKKATFLQQKQFALQLIASDGTTSNIYGFDENACHALATTFTLQRDAHAPEFVVFLIK